MPSALHQTLAPVSLTMLRTLLVSASPPVPLAAKMVTVLAESVFARMDTSWTRRASSVYHFAETTVVELAIAPPRILVNAELVTLPVLKVPASRGVTDVVILESVLLLTTAAVNQAMRRIHKGIVLLNVQVIASQTDDV